MHNNYIECIKEILTVIVFYVVIITVISILKLNFIVSDAPFEIRNQLLQGGYVSVVVSCAILLVYYLGLFCALYFLLVIEKCNFHDIKGLRNSVSVYLIIQLIGEIVKSYLIYIKKGIYNLTTEMDVERLFEDKFYLSFFTIDMISFIVSVILLFAYMSRKIERPNKQVFIIPVLFVVLSFIIFHFKDFTFVLQTIK